MGKKTRHEDLDRTDELPQLNLAAYKASPVPDDDGLARTDTWKGPAITDLQAARISQLEADLQARESVLDSLRGDLEKSASSESQLSSELEGILQRISQLETRLSEAGSLNAALRDQSASLEAANARLQTELETAERTRGEALRLQSEAEAAAQKFRAQLEEQIRNLQAQLAERLQTYEGEQTQARSKHQDLEQRLQTEIGQASAHQQRTAELLELLSAEQSRSQALRDSLREHEQRLNAQTDAARALAQNFAGQLSDIDALGQTLNVRNQRIQHLEETLRQTCDQLRTSEHAVGDAGKQADRLQQQLAADQQRLEEHEREIRLHSANAAELSAQLENKTRDLQKLEALQEQSRLDLEHERKKLEQLERESNDVRTQLLNLRQTLQDATDQSRKLEKALAERGDNLKDRDRRIGEVERSLQEAQQRQDQLTENCVDLERRHQALEAQRQAQEQVALNQSKEIEEWHRSWREITPRLNANDETIQTQLKYIHQLETELHTATNESAAAKSQADQLLEQTKKRDEELAAKGRRIASLEIELGAHVKALNAIGRDIKRASAEVAAPSLLVRSLVAVDDPQIVHLLNRSLMHIGRTPDNDIQVDSKKISRKHACLRVAPTAVILEDLDSTNGVYVNGRRIKKQLLHDGDEVTIGEVRFRLSSRVSTRS